MCPFKGELQFETKTRLRSIGLSKGGANRVTRSMMNKEHCTMKRSIEINSIPNELKQHNQWILWKKQHDKKGKIKKVPHSPFTGKFIDAHDSAH